MLTTAGDRPQSIHQTGGNMRQLRSILRTTWEAALVSWMVFAYYVWNPVWDRGVWAFTKVCLRRTWSFLKPMVLEATVTVGFALAAISAYWAGFALNNDPQRSTPLILSACLLIGATGVSARWAMRAYANS